MSSDLQINVLTQPATYLCMTPDKSIKNFKLLGVGLSRKFDTSLKETLY